MIARAALFIGLLIIPLSAAATTDADLRPRITIDGNTADFTADEWVLDDATAVAEGPRDSRWGTDNDLRGIALTWDNWNLYVAVPATTVNSDLMLFIDTMCDGFSDLARHDVFPRNISLGGMTANFILQITRDRPEPRSIYFDCDNPVNFIDPQRMNAIYVQDGNDGGALEVAIPWELLGGFESAAAGTRLPGAGLTLRIAAAITAGSGGGAGDAGPDPSVVLENDSTRVALIDNHVVIPLDADDDGVLDLGVSPRAIASYATAGSPTERSPLPMTLLVERKVFAPDQGEVVRFQAAVQPDEYGEPVYLTARVYAVSGRLVRRLLEQAPRVLGAAEWDEWDGRDDYGVVVQGGVYIIAVTGAAAPNSPAKPAKASVAVIR